MSELFVGAMCVTTALGLFLLWRWRRGRGACVNVHQGGIEHHFAGRSRALRWQDLDFVTVERRQFSVSGGALPRRVCINVVTKAGSRLQFKNYQRLDALGDAISLRLAEHLSPITLAALQAGRTMDFGVLKVSAKGLRAARLSAGDWHLFVGRKFLAWQDLGSFKLDNERLMLIDKSGRTWASVFHCHVKNVLLLLEIMRGVQERKAPRP